MTEMVVLHCKIHKLRHELSTLILLKGFQISACFLVSPNFQYDKDTGLSSKKDLQRRCPRQGVAKTVPYDEGTAGAGDADFGNEGDSTGHVLKGKEQDLDLMNSIGTKIMKNLQRQASSSLKK